MKFPRSKLYESLHSDAVIYPNYESERVTKCETQKQAKAWLVLKQIDRIRDACLFEAFPTHLQDRSETIITVLADTGVRVGELVALDWDYFDLDADLGEVYLPSETAKATSRRLGRPPFPPQILDQLLSTVATLGILRVHIIEATATDTI